MLKIILILIGIATSQFALSATIGPHYVNGKITNLTAIKAGILISIENSVPENCTSGHTWMLIKEEYSSLVSMAITAWTLGRSASIYTDATSNSYCVINQLDPAE